MSECSQYSGLNVPSYNVQNAQHGPASASPSQQQQAWSQQPTSGTAAAVAPSAQMVTGNYPADGVVVKKKRGRPFGSKNRRNIDAVAAGSHASNPALDTAAHKRRRKTVLVDVGVNTNLSFDVQTSFICDDLTLFEQSLAGKGRLESKKKIQGPVVRVEKGNDYVVNNVKLADTEKDVKCRPNKGADLPNQSLRNKTGSAKKSSILGSHGNAASSYGKVYDKNWACILCHKGSNYNGLGDLYGPYFILVDKSKLAFIHEFEALGEPSEVGESPAVHTQQHIQERRALRKRPELNEEFKNNCKSTATVHTSHSDDSGKANLEVWVHEDCIVWSNNVYMDGSKIRNLEPAIVESFDSVSTEGSDRCDGCSIHGQ